MFPQQLMAAPDGASWFTDGNRTIGRVTTAGRFANLSS